MPTMRLFAAYEGVMLKVGPVEITSVVEINAKMLFASTVGVAIRGLRFDEVRCKPFNPRQDGMEQLVRVALDAFGNPPAPLVVVSFKEASVPVGEGVLPL